MHLATVNDGDQHAQDVNNTPNTSQPQEIKIYSGHHRPGIFSRQLAQLGYARTRMLELGYITMIAWDKFIVQR